MSNKPNLNVLEKLQLLIEQKKSLEDQVSKLEKTIESLNNKDDSDLSTKVNIELSYKFDGLPSVFEKLYTFSPAHKAVFDTIHSSSLEHSSDSDVL
ncbi:MAG: hypothetical protein sL5_10070 [Candidatus Mesenet longicola]|uniref:Uncharacterized protein n=1 Tax=Candidatus Mesenet longicola TaxID=1892558 RepID=A0A8J3HW05_9RICK|nr:MAG: hypothetical protein sGL2_02830 [Candidatus Mesenet longicola]GHM60014.1 MAG: hypothetical protein sL5_10070 [Candidatus Mesenet longicola]